MRITRYKILPMITFVLTFASFVLKCVQLFDKIVFLKVNKVLPARGGGGGGGGLNIKMPSYKYSRDPLTWKSHYLGKTVFILRRGPERFLWLRHYHSAIVTNISNGLLWRSWCKNNGWMHSTKWIITTGSFLEFCYTSTNIKFHSIILSVDPIMHLFV